MTPVFLSHNYLILSFTSWQTFLYTPRHTTSYSSTFSTRQSQVMLELEGIRHP